MRFANVAARAFDRPLLLEPRRGMAFLASLAGMISRSSLETRLDFDRPAPAAFDDDGERRRPTSSLPFGIIEWGA